MMLEIAILDRLQAGHQQRRQLLEFDHTAFFLLGAVQGRNARGIEARVIECRAGVGIGQRGDAVRGQGQVDAPLRLAAFGIHERASRDDEVSIRVLCESTGNLRRGVGLVTRRIEFEQQGLGRHRQTGLQFERTRVDAARQVPGKIIEATAQLAIEVDHIQRQETGRQAQTEPERHAH